MSGRKTKVERLGYATYADYLRSDHWQALRVTVGDAAGWRCPCGAKAREIHHRSYKRLGHERPNDLIALCSDCHERVHRYVTDGVELDVATDEVVFRRDPRPKAARKKKKAAKRKRQPREYTPQELELRAVSRAERRERERERREQRARDRAAQDVRALAHDEARAKARRRLRAQAVVRARAVELDELSREKRRLEKVAASNGPAGAPGGSSGSTRSPGHA